MSYPDALTLTETAALSRMIVRPLARMAAGIAAARSRQANRRIYAYLLDADEHALRDVGLTRAEVRRALLDCDRR